MIAIICKSRISFARSACFPPIVPWRTILYYKGNFNVKRIPINFTLHGQPVIAVAAANVLLMAAPVLFFNDPVNAFYGNMIALSEFLDAFSAFVEIYYFIVPGNDKAFVPVS